MARFEELVSEAAAAPIDGWDFSWLQGRATEQRPSWGYVRLIGARIEAARAVLDVQTGGAEVFGEALERARRPPEVIRATESWPPNLALATQRLARFGGSVEPAPEAGPLPFAEELFDLVVSRHPVVTPWAEIARVLQPGGTFLSQQVGAGTNRELTDFLMGPQPISAARSTGRAVAEAEAAGLSVVDLRQETLRAEFFDIGAVVYFLRLVPWTVPDFAVDAYPEQLRRLHERIQVQGPFLTSVERFLIEARKPPVPPQ